MNIVFSLLKRYQDWHNLNVYRGEFIVYTKDSYSHKSKKKILFRTHTEHDAISKVNQYKSKYPNTVFSYEPVNNSSPKESSE